MRYLIIAVAIVALIWVFFRWLLRASPPVAGGKMTVAEAYEILGLGPGATVEEVKQAHSRLILKLHPDSGGSTYLAIKLNQAKDLLLKHYK